MSTDSWNAFFFGHSNTLARRSGGTVVFDDPGMKNKCGIVAEVTRADRPSVQFEMDG